ncbi:hypothetical protein ACKWRH_24950 [Bradyrhizobium sp. Pa8]|uniref:hypothetical protein n=1 Tax=Bradyrhizobium sp. Pa8 TaxID=3386552 RepID=UPI00403F61B7
MSELPTSPDAPRAPAVIEKRPQLEREMAGLKLQMAERALAAYEGGANERERLANLVAAIRTIEVQIESNALAHKLAQDHDRAAVADWRRQIEANPDEATEGIEKRTCCDLCSEAHGCIITGDACAHPVLAGSVGPRHQGNEAVRGLYRAAAKHLRLPGFGFDEDAEDEDEFEDEDEPEEVET